MRMIIIWHRCIVFDRTRLTSAFFDGRRYVIHR